MRAFDDERWNDAIAVLSEVVKSDQLVHRELALLMLSKSYAETNQPEKAMAAKLAGLIPEWPEADRKRLAALLVRLDDDCAPAQALLGREKEGGRWLTTEDREGLRRRADLHEHIRKARRQKLEVKRLAGTVE